MPSIGKYTITIGDTLLPLNSVLRFGNGDPVDLSLYTVYFGMEQNDGTIELANTTTGVTVHPTQTFTAASNGVATCAGHGLKDGDQLIVASSGTLPGGLAASTRYFAIEVHPNTFGLALTPKGASVITSAGTGLHTFYVVGSVQMDFAAANVDTAGIFYGWFTLVSGSETKVLPEGDRWYEIRVVARGS